MPCSWAGVQDLVPLMVPGAEMHVRPRGLYAGSLWGWSGLSSLRAVWCAADCGGRLG